MGTHFFKENQLYCWSRSYKMWIWFYFSGLPVEIFNSSLSVCIIRVNQCRISLSKWQLFLTLSTNHINVFVTWHVPLVFKDEEGHFFAMEVNCRHQNANLMGGKRKGDIIICPRHGWEYNIKTGDCLTESWAYLRKFDLKVVGEDIWVNPTPKERDEEDSF